MANALFLLSDMCRLCLDNKGEHKIMEHHSFIQDILKFTGIKHISSTDNLPNSVCSLCLYRVYIARDLKSYSTKNELYLNSLLNDSYETLEIARPNVPINISKAKLITECQKKESTIKEKSKDKDESTKYNEKRLENNENQSAEQKSKKPKISVRTLDDINSCLSPEKPKQNTEPVDNQNTKKLASAEVVRKKNCDGTSKKHEKKKNIQKDPKHLASELNKIRTRVLQSLQDDINKCEYCGKTYETSKKLYLHMRSHSKSLYCPLDACGKRFACKGDLQKHLRSHTGEKPYACDLCDKRFAQNVTLRNHKASVHVEKHS